MLSAQPLTQPLPGVSLYGPVGFTDWTEAEVVSPPNHHAVERAHHRLLIQQDFVPSGFPLADDPTLKKSMPPELCVE